MIREVRHELDLTAGDLIEARAIAAVAAAAGAPGTVEYWKSSPWLLNLMRGYKLADLLKEQAKAPSPTLRASMKAAIPLQIDPQAVEQYAALSPANGRMRKLAELAFAEGMARRLWVAPSMPYFGTHQPVSKMLIFSEWTMVPDAIAGFLSYEAERQMGMGKGHGYTDPPTTRPLQFRRAQGRLAGLRALQLVIPSPRLAARADPLALLREDGPFPDLDALRRAAAKRLRPLAQNLTDRSTEAAEGGWDWSSAAALDIANSGFADWLSSPTLRQEGDEESWPDHLAELAHAAKRPIGRADTEQVLAHLVDVALGSPATCAHYRASHPVFRWTIPHFFPQPRMSAWRSGRCSTIRRRRRFCAPKAMSTGGPFCVMRLGMTCSLSWTNTPMCCSRRKDWLAMRPSLPYA